MTAYDRNIARREFQAPVIAGVEITTDAQGRFNLNALHRASGGANSKRPSIWLATQQAQELVAELVSQSKDSGFGVLNVIKGGNAPGTFAAEELAVSYAGWISPSFQLEVNRTFIAYRKGELSGPVSVPSIAATREARQLFKMLNSIGKEARLDPNQRLLAANQGTISLTGVDLLGSIGMKQIEAPQPTASLKAGDIGVRIGGRSAKVINLALTSFGYQDAFRDTSGNPYYEPTEKGLAAGAIMVDTSKKRGDGTPIRQLRWAGTVVDLLRADLEGGAA